MKDIRPELQNLANKLRALWGNNPDSALIEEAIRLLPEAEAAAEEAAEPTTRRKKG